MEVFICSFSRDVSRRSGPFRMRILHLTFRKSSNWRAWMRVVHWRRGRTKKTTLYRRKKTTANLRQRSWHFESHSSTSLRDWEFETRTSRSRRRWPRAFSSIWRNRLSFSVKAWFHTFSFFSYSASFPSTFQRRFVDSSFSLKSDSSLLIILRLSDW